MAKHFSKQVLGSGCVFTEEAHVTLLNLGGETELEEQVESETELEQYRNCRN